MKMDVAVILDLLCLLHLWSQTLTGAADHCERNTIMRFLSMMVMYGIGTRSTSTWNAVLWVAKVYIVYPELLLFPKPLHVDWTRQCNSEAVSEAIRECRTTPRHIHLRTTPQPHVNGCDPAYGELTSFHVEILAVDQGASRGPNVLQASARKECLCHSSRDQSRSFIS